MGGETKTVETRSLTPEQKDLYNSIMRALGYQWAPVSGGTPGREFASNLANMPGYKGLFGKQLLEKMGLSGGQWGYTGQMQPGWGLTPEEEQLQLAQTWAGIKPQFQKQRQLMAGDYGTRNISGGARFQEGMRLGAEEAGAYSDLATQTKIQNALNKIRIRQFLMQLASGTLGGTGVSTQTTSEPFDPVGTATDIGMIVAALAKKPATAKTKELPYGDYNYEPIYYG